MVLSVFSRAWRAGSSRAAWPGSVRPIHARKPLSVRSAESDGRSAEPFGLAAASLTDGGLRDKWLGVQRRLDDEMVQLALCDGDREGCVSPAALKFLAIVDAARLRDGRARLGEINRAINLAVRPMSDLAQYGRIDVWTSPLATLARGGGDCEDYAIAKFVALAPGRHRARRPADRGHARHRPRRGPRRRRRAAGWALADARQPPHGDGRGFRREELSADIRDRPARRDAIRGCPAARRRLRPDLSAGDREYAASFGSVSSRRRTSELAEPQMTAHLRCALIAKAHDKPSLPDLAFLMPMVRCSQDSTCIPFGENMTIQIFSFCFSLSRFD